jgi:stress-induced morphogen
MAMESAEIVQLIQESIPDAEVRIDDLRGDGDHYSALVLSASFKGKSRIQQHQLVYKALKGRMGDQLHALALKTGTPTES